MYRSGTVDLFMQGMDDVAYLGRYQLARVRSVYLRSRET